MALKKERAIVSETELDSVATGATEPDAETGEADDVSDYSEEPGGLDPAGEAEDVASPADGALDESAADAQEEPADGALDESAADAQEEPRRWSPRRTPRRNRPTARWMSP